VPKLGTNTVIANGILLNGDSHPCVLVNDKIHPSNSMHLRVHYLNGEIHPSNSMHLRMHFLNGEIHLSNSMHLRMHF